MPASPIKFIWTESLDPSELLDYDTDWSSVLVGGEAIYAYSVVVPAESLLYGLEVENSGGYEPSVTGAIIKIWVSVGAGHRNDPEFTAGITLPIEITIQTDSTPARFRQRTFGVKVIQR